MDTVWATRENLVEADKVRNQKLYSFNANRIFIDSDMDKLYELPVVSISPRGVFITVMSPKDFGPSHELKLRLWRIRHSQWGVCYKSKLEALHALLCKKIDQLSMDVRNMALGAGCEVSEYRSEPSPTEGCVNRMEMNMSLPDAAVELEQVEELYKLYLAEMKKQ